MWKLRSRKPQTSVGSELTTYQLQSLQINPMKLFNSNRLSYQEESVLWIKSYDDWHLCCIIFFEDLSLFISKSSEVSQIEQRINKHRGTKLLVITKIPVFKILDFYCSKSFQRNTSRWPYSLKTFRWRSLDQFKIEFCIPTRSNCDRCQKRLCFKTLFSVKKRDQN